MLPLSEETGVHVSHEADAKLEYDKIKIASNCPSLEKQRCKYKVQR